MNIVEKNESRQRILFGVLAGSALISLTGCSSNNDDDIVQPPQQAAQSTLVCDETIKTAFKPDPDTTVLTVKSFKKGDALLLSGTLETLFKYMGRRKSMAGWRFPSFWPAPW